MNSKNQSTDPDIRAALPALRRAARAARRLAARTNTPICVMREGRVVSLRVPRNRARSKS